MGCGLLAFCSRLRGASSHLRAVHAATRVADLPQLPHSLLCLLGMQSTAAFPFGTICVITIIWCAHSAVAKRSVSCSQLDVASCHGGS